VKNVKVENNIIDFSVKEHPENEKKNHKIRKIFLKTYIS
jgi:hypothetical protein